MMQLVVGHPKVIETKGKYWSFISFPLYELIDDENVQIVKGFRIVKGMVYPPATQIGNGRYLNLWGANQAMALKLYEAIKVQEGESEEWREALKVAGGLLGREEATKLLLYDVGATRLAFE